MKLTSIIMNGVTEYAEGYEVRLVRTDGVYTAGKPMQEWQGNGRWAIKAFNEAGCNSTEVDLLELLDWLKSNSHLLEEMREDQ